MAVEEVRNPTLVAPTATATGTAAHSAGARARARSDPPNATADHPTVRTVTPVRRAAARAPARAPTLSTENSRV